MPSEEEEEEEEEKKKKKKKKNPKIFVHHHHHHHHLASRVLGLELFRSHEQSRSLWRGRPWLHFPHG